MCVVGARTFAVLGQRDSIPHTIQQPRGLAIFAIRHREEELLHCSSRQAYSCPSLLCAPFSDVYLYVLPKDPTVGSLAVVHRTP